MYLISWSDVETLGFCVADAMQCNQPRERACDTESFTATLASFQWRVALQKCASSRILIGRAKARAGHIPWMALNPGDVLPHLDLLHTSRAAKVGRVALRNGGYQGTWKSLPSQCGPISHLLSFKVHDQPIRANAICRQESGITARASKSGDAARVRTLAHTGKGSIIETRVTSQGYYSRTIHYSLERNWN